MRERFAGRNVVVTGGGSGLGEAMARAFAAEGAGVVVADIQEDKGRRIAEEIGEAARFVRTDVTAEPDVANAVDTAVRELGSLDVMVNNAGIVGVIGPIADTSLDAYEATMAVLLRGTFLGMKHAARVMVPRRSGAIVSMSSEAAFVGGPGPHVYSAAKAGVVGLTMAVASELREYDIRVNCVAPGPIVSPMTADVVVGDPDDLDAAHAALGGMSRLGRPGVPADVAAAVLYLASDEAGWVVGHALRVDSGRTVAPSPAFFLESEDPVGEVMLREAGRRGV